MPDPDQDQNWSQRISKTGLHSRLLLTVNLNHCYFFVYFFSVLGCVGHFFAYNALFVILSDARILTQRDVVASRRATNLATHLSDLATHLPITQPSPYLASHHRT
jgi:hypothetical protein